MPPMPAHPVVASPPLAAIDMGSNSFRLEIGAVRGSRYSRSLYVKDTVRLGAGLDAHGHLTEAAARRGLDCLARYAGLLRGFEPARVRAVATQTLREARNRDEFLVRAQQALGFAIEVISGREEARLIYAGVDHLQPSSTPRLVIDIGGRSTEMILGHGRLPSVAESFQVGSVGLTLQWFADGHLSAEAFRAAQVAAGAELEEALQAFAPSAWREALGSSGTVSAVSQVLRAAGVSDGRITADGLRWCIEQCLAAGHVRRLDLPSLQPDRRPILAGGLALLYTLVVQFGIRELFPARGALRQGVIVDLHERRAAQYGQGAGDMREHTVRELQIRFDVDVEQARRVRSVALALLTHAGPRIDRQTLRELGWAADLHEVGLAVSHHDHHRHSAYLIAHADAPGFSQSQQRRIADLLLAQRGALRKLGDSLEIASFAWQVMALRLAVIACHARQELDPGSLRMRRDGSRAQLAYPAKWAARNPRTVHLLREEARAWAEQDGLQLVLPDPR